MTGVYPRDVVHIRAEVHAYEALPARVRELVEYAERLVGQITERV